jgi:hypothetical protein
MKTKKKETFNATNKKLLILNKLFTFLIPYFFN